MHIPYILDKVNITDSNAKLFVLQYPPRLFYFAKWPKHFYIKDIEKDYFMREEIIMACR